MVDYREIITINPNIRFGRPCIKGTRISVYDVLGWLSIGMSHEEIFEDFPEITEEDILPSLAYVSA
jgi:uncharacterized protein (DUF433 family)